MQRYVSAASSCPTSAGVETVSPTLFSMQLFLIQNNKYCFSPISVAGQYQISFQNSSHIPFPAGSLEPLQHNKLFVLYASVMGSLHVSQTQRKAGRDSYSQRSPSPTASASQDCPRRKAHTESVGQMLPELWQAGAAATSQGSLHKCPTTFPVEHDLSTV